VSGFLLDTNLISEAVSVQPEPKVLAWMDSADERTLFLSVFTLGEIRKGIEKLVVPSKRRAQLETWLEVDVRRRFAGRILPVDETVADRWGILSAEMKRQGNSLPVVDAILAATALHHNLAVVTRNVDHFKSANLRVINPWQTA
jgi:predicted nucleic acid-binding protein